MFARLKDLLLAVADIIVPSAFIFVTVFALVHLIITFW